jgi:hypothetical protein
VDGSGHTNVTVGWDPCLIGGNSMISSVVI